jgi:hypothetical protein
MDFGLGTVFSKSNATNYLVQLHIKVRPPYCHALLVLPGSLFFLWKDVSFFAGDRSIERLPGQPGIALLL